MSAAPTSPVKAATNGTSASFAKFVSPLICDVDAADVRARRAALKRHNLYRKQYGAKPLVWSTTLAAAAQKWASQCKWEHSGGSVGAYGENIAAGQTTINAVVDAWVNGPNESGSYDPKNPTASHFTQVVWKSTKQVRSVSLLGSSTPSDSLVAGRMRKGSLPGYRQPSASESGLLGLRIRSAGTFLLYLLSILC